MLLGMGVREGLAAPVFAAAGSSLPDQPGAVRVMLMDFSMTVPMAQVALRRPDDRIKAVGDIVSELLSMDESRRRIAGMVSGLDIHYDLSEGHPLLGRRMPDLDLVTTEGPLRVFTALHDARPVLLNLGEPGGFDITPWVDRVQMLDAECAGPWELPVLGGGHCSHRRVDSARRICGLGGRRHGPWAP